MTPWNKEKYLKLAKGKAGKARNVWSVMLNKVHKSLSHARYGRQRKPRLFRRQWIQTVNAGSREHELTYSQF
jgi:large subunit ribosomal protein L20